MSHIEQWNAIAARIRSLRNAADLYAQFVIARGSDFSVGQDLLRQCLSIRQAIDNFHRSFYLTLPPAAKVDRFQDDRSWELTSDVMKLQDEMKAGPIRLTLFEMEMSFFLSDAQSGAIGAGVPALAAVTCC